MSNVDNAVAEMKKQLRAESKANLIRQWIALYAQVIQMQIENEKLKKELEALKPKTEAKEDNLSLENIEQESSEGSET